MRPFWRPTRELRALASRIGALVRADILAGTSVPGAIYGVGNHLVEAGAAFDPVYVTRFIVCVERIVARPAIEVIGASLSQRTVF